MARSLAVFLLALLLAGAALSGVPAGAAPGDAPPAGPRAETPVYRGPTALFDPADPFQGLKWTLGITAPPRTRIGLGQKGLTQQVVYDADRHLVLLSYRAGQEEILPPQALTPKEYADLAFSRQLRRSWIEGNRRVLSESRGAGQEGLVNLSLPFQIPFTEKIFGEGAPNLRVTGSEQITFSGTSSWVSGQVTGERGGGSIFPKLDMRQRLNVNLQGTIGSKLFIDVSQNSEALTPLENSMRIRYKGDEDEIVKSVELGNTNLSLPATQFVSFSTRQEGLFGVKATAEVGNIGITAIASRQEGENGQATLVGGAKEQKQTIQDVGFLQGRYFFFADPDSAPVPNIPAGSVHVYLDDKDSRNDRELGALPAEVWIDPNANPKEPAGKPYTGNFHLLHEEDDYVVVNNQNLASIPILVLRNSLSFNQVLAVSYKLGNGTEVGTFTIAAGDTADGKKIQLKMLRPDMTTWGGDDLTRSPWRVVRRLEWKNVYSLGARNIDMDSFDLKVVLDEGANNPADITDDNGKTIPLLQVFGLDQRNNDDASDFTPDGRVDPEFVDPGEGLLFFPDLRPFDPSPVDLNGGPPGYRSRSWAGTRPYILKPDQRVPEIYDLRSDVLQSKSAQYHKYNIDATFRTSVNTLELNPLGTILEGSETVRLNGEVLQRGTDYTIYYDTGTINLKSDRATAPGADLVVTYSYDSPFSRGSRSLIGASIGTKPDPNAKYSLSTSWLHESRGTPDQRPRLGNEPTKTTVGDISGQLRLTPWALTDWVDRLPLVSTTVPSRIDVTGALGLSLPDPNTKNVVYVDDMEGAEIQNGPSTQRYSWFWSSAPARAQEPVPGGGEVDVTPEATDRGQMLWFSPNTVQVGDITPGAETEQERNDLVSTLEVIYVPRPDAGPNGSWGGLVSTLAGNSGVDISKAQYLDVWINDYQNFQTDRGRRRGELLVDVGTVSEDAVWDPLVPADPPNRKLDTEDLNNNGGQVEYTEDIGLDQKDDGQEPDRPDAIRTTSIPASQDPAGDDRPQEVQTSLPERTVNERLVKYRGINGTERNQSLDTEDLNGDGNLQTFNSYAEYRVALADSAFQDLGRDYPDRYSKPGNGWRLYRIPLSETHLEVGSPDFTAAQHMRIWFRGIDPGDTLDVQIASIDIVGNRWEVAPQTTSELAGNEIFNIAVVNNKENKSYRPPFGVRRINNVEEREQSISLEFENFQPEADLRAYRTLADSRDYTLYQTIAYYLNPRLETLAPDDSVEFYIRFGSDAATDTLSYYEIATKLTQDDPRRRGDGWLDFRFDITDVANLKIGAPPGVSPDSFLVGGPPPAEPPPVAGGGGGGKHFREYNAAAAAVASWRPPADIGHGLYASIRGNPSFSRVKRISMGLRNPSGQILSEGQVWVDELRMGNVRRDTGVAARAAANLILADLAVLNGSVTTTSADFLRLGQTRGTGTTNLGYNLGTEINLHKFVEPLHLQAPLKLNWKRDRQTPKFIPSSDIEYSGNSTGREITETGQRTISLGLARDVRGLGSPLTRYTIDAVRMNGTAIKTYSVGVTQVDSTSQTTGNLTYQLNFAQIRPLRVLNRVDFWPWPRSFNLALTGGKAERRRYSRDERDPSILNFANGSNTRTGVLTLSTSLQPIQSLTWGWNSTRDLIDDHFGPDTSIVRLQRPVRSIFGIDVGREIRQTQNLSYNFVPPFADAFRPRVTWSSSYSRNSDPNLTRAEYDSTVVELSNNNNTNLSLTLPITRMIQKLLPAPEAKSQGGAQRERAADPRVRNLAPGHVDTTGLGATARTAEGAGGEEDKDKEEDKGPGAGEQFRRLFTRYLVLGDVQTSATFGRQSSYSGIHGDAPLGYRLGLTRDPGIGTNLFPVYGAARNQTLGESQTYRGNTSLKLLNRVGLDFSFQKRKDRNRTNGGLGRVQDDTTWPEIRFNWGDIHKKLPLINTVFTDFRAVSSTYSKNVKKSGTEVNPAETVTTSVNWRPLISIQGTLRGNWQTNFSANTSSTETLSQREGSAGFTTTRSSVTYALSFRKRFVRPQASGLGKDIDLSIETNYTGQSTVTESLTGLGNPAPQKSDNLQLRTSATVRLTRTMSGTFSLNFGQERNLTTRLTRRSLGLAFTTGFNF